MDNDVDYKALYEQVSEEVTQLRMHILKEANAKSPFSGLNAKIARAFNNPMRLYAYCYVALVATYVLTTIVDTFRRKHD